MNKDYVPEDYTLGLALFDAVPVLLFGIACFLQWKMTQSLLVLLGGIVCFTAGMLKVLWKIIVVTRKKNVWPLFVQMRIGMPAGFGLILIGLIVGVFWGNTVLFLQSIWHIHIMVFIVLTVIGMTGMIICGSRLDSKKASSNWIEEVCNTFAQGAFLIAMVLTYKLM